MPFQWNIDLFVINNRKTNIFQCEVNHINFLNYEVDVKLDANCSKVWQK